ncbi:MAG TPA: PRC-barrel domain-containing protein [Candidatus Limnocylindria bacterium]|nr:PRC-barrel domain-containing protein [Candidatus Limnocylindria bacterium]
MKTTQSLTAAIAAIAVLIGLQFAYAERNSGGYPGLKHTSGKPASELIGKKVINDQDEKLGKVQDIIVDVDAGTAPYAVISQGNLASGHTKVAVPLTSLRCAADGKSVVLSATKDDLQSATKASTGEWAGVAEAEWAQNVDAFYGHPTPLNSESATLYYHDDSQDSRTVLTPPPMRKGAEQLMALQDPTLGERISEKLNVVTVRVENGVTYLYGTVDNDDLRQDFESKIRSVQGVDKVENHLKVRNP